MDGRPRSGSGFSSISTPAPEENPQPVEAGPTLERIVSTEEVASSVDTAQSPLHSWLRAARRPGWRSLSHWEESKPLEEELVEEVAAGGSQ